MNVFPSVDPIPLPAPVWLLKALHILTLSLHFVAVMTLLGGLLLAVVLNFLGTKDKTKHQASAAIAWRMPLVMTYVINFGVPPLLFTQAMYGVALYTSSVLIGAYWISVIFLVMGCYWLLYQFSYGVQAGRQVAWKGLLAWCLAGMVSRIFSTNMTLMLRPEVWNQMYTATTSGTQLPPADPTLLPRWLFMLFGGFTVSGFWLLWIAGRKSVRGPLNRFLAGLGGMVSSVALVAQAACYHQILLAQPKAVSDAIQNTPWLHTVSLVWYGIALVMLLLALFSAIKKPCSYWMGYVSVLIVLLQVLSWVVVRDSIRDLTLLSKGFDVWKLPVAANWSVLITFLLFFVAGLGMVGWLIWVMMKAKPVLEGEA